MNAAFRHLVRGRRRTVLAALAVFVPVFLLVVSLGMIGGMEQDMFTALTGFDTGHFQIREKGDGPAGGALPIIRDPAPLLAVLDESDDVAWYTVRLDLPALAAAGERSLGVVVQGIRPAEAALHSPLARTVAAGRYLEPGDDGAVVGGGLLDALNLSLRDELVLLGGHPQGAAGVALPRVVGVFDIPDPALGRGLVQVDLGVAQRLVRATGITAIVGYIRGVDGPWDGPRIEAAVNRIRARLPEGYEILDWTELAPESQLLMRYMRVSTVAFMAAFFVLGGLVVLNTLYLSVLERTRELGIILALGASRRYVMGQVLLESGLLAAGAALVGAAGGLAFVMGVEAAGGIPLPGEYEEMMAVLGMDALLRMRITATEVVLSALAMVAVAVAAAWYPAWRAARLEPVETMRHAA
jgi:ABC-type lipoprotein release transport system permease subunit